MGFTPSLAGLGRALHLGLALALVPAAFQTAYCLPDPPDHTVRVFYIRPTDVAENPKYATGIASVMKDAQKYYLDQCKFTFRLNEPVVEVVQGSHPRSWYEKTQSGSDSHWWTVNNGQADLLNRVPSLKADGNRRRWKIVFYIDAAGNGGGGVGWVLLRP